MDAISSAEHLHLFMQHADRIFMAAVAQPINVIHSLFLTRASDGVLVKTPAFYVFKMFNPHHSSGAKWAPNTLVTENVRGNNTDIPVISAGTTVDSQGRVNISLANVDLVEHANGSDHAEQHQGRLRRRECASHHRPGKGHVQRLRPGGAREHSDVAGFELHALREIAQGDPAVQERRHARLDAAVAGDGYGVIVGDGVPVTTSGQRGFDALLGQRPAVLWYQARS